MIEFSRRDWLRTCGLSWAGWSLSGWLSPLAESFADAVNRRRHCILLWMPGGPSQTDTFDMKPGHENGGEFKEIETRVPGVRISERLPKLAQQMEHLAIVRSLSTAEGDHNRGAFLMHITDKNGYLEAKELPGNLATQMELWDGDGRITGDEIPLTLAVTFSQGNRSFDSARLVQFGARGGPRAQPAARPGPEWFIRMDRNGDGDVTLREFLGGEKQFGKLDTNGDGFIELREAEAAK